MAEKACLLGDHAARRTITCTSAARLHKSLERSVRRFEPDWWDTQREHIAFMGNYAKFSQNPDMPRRLVATDNRVLAEASSYDVLWGIGLQAVHAAARHQNLHGAVRIFSTLFCSVSVAFC